jgi:perosamine synthetase
MSWFVYVVRLWPGWDRDRAIQELERREIPARPYFPPIHLQPVYRALGHRPGDFPVAEAAGASCLALPFFSAMREAQVDAVCGALLEVLEVVAAKPAGRRAVG